MIQPSLLFLAFSTSIALGYNKSLITPQNSGQRPTVTSEALTTTIHGKNLVKHAEELLSFATRNGAGNRVFGTRSHNETVDYIKKQLDATGYYDTQLQTYSELYLEGTANLTVNGLAYDAEWMTYSPAGHIVGPLVSVNDLGCKQNDYPTNMTDKIALISRGACPFSLKVALAGKSGAAAAIIYNNETEVLQGGISQDALPEGPAVPACGISAESGQKLLADINARKTFNGALNITVINEKRYTSNVLATTKTGDQTNVVMVGGHTDSVNAGPGINDNASGSIAVLEIALQLARFEVKHAIRFGFWTAEENGLLGSIHYLSSLSADEGNNIALYLNADMLASPNFGYFIYDGDSSVFNVTGPAGSDRIERVLEDYYKSSGIKTAPTSLGGGSDHLSFMGFGIPVGGVFSGTDENKTQEEFTWWGGVAGAPYDACYHKACDNIQNLNVGAWVNNTKAMAHAVSTFAMSLDGVPRRVETKSDTVRRMLDGDSGSYWRNASRIVMY
ncbi:hypothetical protein AMATHDRAFT_67605 [Amanita thiersii Skay4041]|uniref:Peptide hydrolase n=1 Tax=Amanita thiersii Skay4041 TaxID=703135 RepID=A0A2A9NIN6_9AGAR|nr:hypothetical protein AMATHDRAFT_67605 [Amanita thiersii Skay4041]